MTNERKSKIILINNNYEKMLARKNAVLKGNAEATQCNKKIEKSKKINFVLSFVFSLLLGGAAAAVFLLYSTIPIHGISLTVSKMIYAGIAAVCAVVIVEAFALMRVRDLESQKKDIVALTEPMKFVTAANNKEVKDYSITRYKNVPYEMQKVYVNFTMEENEKRSEYVSAEKWGFVLLPTLFDVVIDAENAVVYAPYESEDTDDNIKAEIGTQISRELLLIERQARVEAEERLKNVLSEKEAVERVLEKNTETTLELRKKLDSTDDIIRTINLKHAAEREDMVKVFKASKEEKEEIITELTEKNESLTSELESTNKVLEEKTKSENELEERVDTLNRDLVSEKQEKESAQRALSETKAALEEKIEKEAVLLRDVETYNSKLNEAEKEKEKLQFSLSETIDNLKEKEEREQELEEENKKLKTATEDMKKVNSVLSSHLQAAVAEKAESDTKAEKLASELKEINLENESLKEKVLEGEKVAAEKIELQEKLRVLEGNFENVKAEHNDAKEQISRLENKVAEGEAENSLLKKENGELKSDKEIVKAELDKTQKALEVETSARKQCENDLSSEKRKTDFLGSKMDENKKVVSELKQSFNAEKQKLLSDLEKTKKTLLKTRNEVEAIRASSGVQERALLKEKDELAEKIAELELQIKELPSVKEENQNLKKELTDAKNENVNLVKKEYEERIAFIKEEKSKVEKKMREALESAAQEKADRIKSEEALKTFLSEKEKAEQEEKKKAHEAEVKKAKEATKKAEEDAKKAQEEKIGKENTEKEVKKPQRRLNI